MHRLVIAMMVCISAAVGCKESKPTPRPCCPHAHPGCHDVFHRPCHPSNRCPGPSCPTGSIEVGEIGDEVDTESLEETKSGDCVICPPGSTTLVSTDANTPREGVFTCWNCKRRTVGREWKEIWADDGTSLLCICRSCWDTSTPAKREQVLNRYIASSNLNASQRYHARNAIRELSRK